MPTRRDQLQAYRFQNQRALAALVTGEPDVVEPPMRRLTVTTISGVMIAVLVAAGFAVFGLIKPAGNDDWKAGGAVIVENQTGATYIRIDGVLHPVLNYASAVLAVGSNQTAHVVRVDRSQLDGAKRGATIGIDGLPASLPAASGLVTSPFTLCSRTQAGTGTTLVTRVSLEVGNDVGATRLPSGAAVLVRSAADGNRYLLVGGKRLLIGSARVANALQLESSTPVTVGTAFLDGIAAGPPLAAPTVPAAGTPSPTRVAGHPLLVGQLLHDTDDDQYLLVLDDGVAALDQVQARVLETLALTPTGGDVEPQDVSRSDVIDLTPSTKAWAAVSQRLAGLPTTVPRVNDTVGRGGGVCALFRGGSATPSFAVPPSLLPSYSSPAVSQSARSARGIADTVSVSGGKAALVTSSDHSTTVFLVGEPGRKYAATGRQVLTGFGYGSVQPSVVPAQLLTLIPTGPALDPAAARTPVSG